MTHGLGDSMATWTELLPALTGGNEVICWDLLGHGESAKPIEKDAYSRGIAIADLDDVLALADDDAVLVGHSLGGYLTQCRAVSNPKGLRGLVLIATGPGYRDPESRARWNRYAGRAADRFDIPPAAVGMVEQHDDIVMAHLDRLTLPILQIVGEKDTTYHGAFAYLERRLPHVKSLRVSGAGHHVHRSHADEVGLAIRSFLEDLP